MSELLLQFAFLIFIIFVVVTIVVKELKKKKIISNSSNNKKQEIKKEIKKTNDDLTYVQENNQIEKLLLNLDEMVDREDEEPNKMNLNFFSTVINNDADFVRSAKDTIVLDKEEMQSKSQILDIKLGSEISAIVQRVDEDGNIVLGMEALKFITGDNIPLITPKGAIRVFNILTLEEGVSICLETNKPLFVQDTKTKSIKRIEKDELESLIINREEIESKRLAIKNEKESIELANRNNFLEEKIEELKNQILKLEAKNEILESMMKGNNVPGVENNQDDKVALSAKEEIKIIVSDDIKVSPIQEEKKVEYQQNINQSKNDNTKKEEQVAQSKTETREFNGARIEKVVEEKPINKKEENNDDNLKTLSKKTADSFIGDFFLEYLLRKNGGDNRSLKPNELDFITYEQESGTKRYLLRYLYKNTAVKLGEFLIKNEYKNDEKNLALILNNEKITIKDEAYFQNAKDMQLYKSKIIEVVFMQDEISPYGLINI